MGAWRWRQATALVLTFVLGMVFHALLNEGMTALSGFQPEQPQVHGSGVLTPQRPVEQVAVTTTTRSSTPNSSSPSLSPNAGSTSSPRGGVVSPPPVPRRPFNASAGAGMRPAPIVQGVGDHWATGLGKCDPLPPLPSSVQCTRHDLEEPSK